MSRAIRIKKATDGVKKMKRSFVSSVGEFSPQSRCKRMNDMDTKEVPKIVYVICPRIYTPFANLVDRRTRIGKEKASVTTNGIHRIVIVIKKQASHIRQDQTTMYSPSTRSIAFRHLKPCPPMAG